MSAINVYSDTSYPEQPSLFVELIGSEDGLADELELVKSVATRAGATEIVHEQRAEERARLWKARHDATHAATARVPGSKERTTDVCVPLTQLVRAVHYAHTEIQRLGLQAGILGHAGDGNVHVGIYIDPNDADEVA